MEYPLPLRLAIRLATASVLLAATSCYDDRKPDELPKDTPQSFDAKVPGEAHLGNREVVPVRTPPDFHYSGPPAPTEANSGGESGDDHFEITPSEEPVLAKPEFALKSFPGGFNSTEGHTDNISAAVPDTGLTLLLLAIALVGLRVFFLPVTKGRPGKRG